MKVRDGHYSEMWREQLQNEAATATAADDTVITCLCCKNSNQAGVRCDCTCQCHDISPDTDSNISNGTAFEQDCPTNCNETAGMSNAFENDNTKKYVFDRAALGNGAVSKSLSSIVVNNDHNVRHRADTNDTSNGRQQKRQQQLLSRFLSAPGVDTHPRVMGADASHRPSDRTIGSDLLLLHNLTNNHQTEPCAKSLADLTEAEHLQAAGVSEDDIVGLMTSDANCRYTTPSGATK